VKPGIDQVPGFVPTTIGIRRDPTEIGLDSDPANERGFLIMKT